MGFDSVLSYSSEPLLIVMKLYYFIRNLIIAMQIKYVKHHKFFYIFKEFSAAPFIIWKCVQVY